MPFAVQIHRYWSCVVIVHLPYAWLVYMSSYSCYHKVMEHRAYTGELLQHETLGEPLHPDAETGELEYLPYRTAMSVVREMQPFDPTDPTPSFANDLHATVAEKLGLTDYSTLRFYTALGTSLDRHHGVDGFFEWDAPEGGTAVVTLDITLRDKGAYKADVLLWVADEAALDRQNERDHYDHLLDSFAADVVSSLRSKAAPKGGRR